MGEKKERLRVQFLRQRKSIPPSQLALQSRLIQERVLHFDLYLMSRSVALYSPMGNEVATEEIRDHALREGKRLFYPRLGEGDNLDLVHIESAEELRLGHHGFLEPTGERLMTRRDQEKLIVFVPGVVFDLDGNRLGRGKGWYDRVMDRLERGVVLAALAYEFQVVERVPAERRDHKVHYIITERGVIDCGGAVSSRPGRLS